jgi:hypothetical protein
MIPSDWIERAHAVRIEAEIERRGIKLVGKTDRCGACPQCGGHDRFSINIRKQVFLCRGCGARGDVIALVQFLDICDFREAVEQLTGERASENRDPAPAKIIATDDAKPRDKARWFWRRRQPIADTIAETYLRQARGYSAAVPPTLGFLPARGDHPPAMIAAFGLPFEPEPGELAIGDDAVMAVHLTKLRPDGSGKADVEPNKIIIGKGALGLPIVLSPPNDLLGLTIHEGIENALSAYEATGLGAWASGGWGRMPALAVTVPSYIDFVTIVADRDPGGVKGAIALADGLRQRKISHVVTFPDGEIVS